MSIPTIPYNRFFLTGNEERYIADAIASNHIEGDGPYTARCHQWLQQTLNSPHALLTHSGTAALEMAVILAGVGPGDEVILPSYTFSSSATAIVSVGAVPVFVDIREDNFNIDESLIEPQITSKTKAIMVVHYAGAACEMDTVMAIAARHDLKVIEDAAQALVADYRGKSLGTIGHFGCISFHSTKNIVCGEGGALLMQDEEDFGRALVIREKGTNRTQFIEGKADKYTWVDKGSSYLPPETSAAFLWAQLEQAKEITQKRVENWRYYRSELGSNGVPDYCQLPDEMDGHNGHIFPLIFDSPEIRQQIAKRLQAQGVIAYSHYVPLHSSPAGLKYGRVATTMAVTDRVANGILRLPVWVGLDRKRVVDAVCKSFESELNG